MESLTLATHQLQPTETTVAHDPDEGIYRAGVVAKMLIHNAVLIEGPDVSANTKLLDSVDNLGKTFGAPMFRIDGGLVSTPDELENLNAEVESFVTAEGHKTLLVDRIDSLMSMTGDEEIDGKKRELVARIASCAVSNNSMISLVASAKSLFETASSRCEYLPEQAFILGIFASEDKRYAFHGFGKARKLAEKTFRNDRFQLTYRTHLSGLRDQLRKRTDLLVT